MQNISSKIKLIVPFDALPKILNIIAVIKTYSTPIKIPLTRPLFSLTENKQPKKIEMIFINWLTLFIAVSDRLVSFIISANIKTPKTVENVEMSAPFTVCLINALLSILLDIKNPDIF